MSSLPEEIYLDIILRLPVKSILVCKSVSKSWYALISNHDFVKSHLDLTTQRNNCSIMFKYDKSYGLFSRNDSDDALVVELEPPCKYLRNLHNKLLGSCNGLVYGWNSQMRFFFLWNPATKEYNRLPKPDGDYRNAGYHGFGYDYKTDDYKLVRIIGKRKSSLVQIYSLRLNSWKSSQSILHYEFPYSEDFGVLCNGALHWFGDLKGKGSSRIIVSIDISEETFQEFQPPMILPDQCCMSIGVLEECLCVLVRDMEILKVWVMQDYGVPGSWNKLYTITYESMISSSLYFWGYAEIIASSKNGEILFRVGNTVVSYDSKYGTARKTEIDYLDRGGAVKYFESLISLNSNTVVGRSQKKANTTKKRNRCPSIDEALAGRQMG